MSGEKLKHFTLLKRSLPQKSKSLMLLALFTITLSPVRAQEPTPAQDLPEIEAKQYSTYYVRKSRSGRIFLMRAGDAEMPKAGKILLIKKNSEPLMALRVLKTYPDKNEFAGKRVKVYQTPPRFGKGDSFATVEKIRDVLSELGAATTAEEAAQDASDLEELEKPVRSQPKSVSPKESLEEVEDTQIKSSARLLPPERSENPEKDDWGRNLEDEELVAEEILPLDSDYNWLSFNFGYLRNDSSSGGTSYYSAGGIQYAHDLGKYIFAESAHVQDSFSLELGLFVYRVYGYLQAADSFTVVPFTVTGRYNLFLGESHVIYGYAGFNKALVTGPTDQEVAASRLGALRPSFGMGIMFRVGPKWNIKVNLGYDMIIGGLVIRY